MTRIFFVFLVLIGTHILPSQVPNIFIEKPRLERSVLETKLALEINASSITVDTLSFPAGNNWKDNFLVAKIFTKDGKLVFDGSIAPSGLLNIEYAAKKINSTLFSIPIEQLQCSGKQQLEIKIFLQHKYLSLDQLITTFAVGEITLPAFAVYYWNVSSLSIPESNSYDIRFMGRSMDGCNADLYAVLYRNNRQQYRSSVLDNSCYLNNLKIRVVNYPKSKWDLAANDFDNTSFDDKIGYFSLGEISNFTMGENQFTASGCTLRLSSELQNEPKLDWYSTSMQLSETRNIDGVTGILCTCKGTELSTLSSSWFTRELVILGQTRKDATLLANNADSISYFYPYYLLPAGYIQGNWRIGYSFDNSLAALYRSKNSVLAPEVILDNTFSNLQTSIAKYNGSMCLKVKVHHSMPNVHVRNLVIDAQIGSYEPLMEKGTDPSPSQSESDLIYYYPLYKLSDNSEIPLHFSSRNNFMGMNRSFNFLQDTISVKTELETITLRIFSQMEEDMLKDSKWKIKSSAIGEVLEVRDVNSQYSDFTIRKHPEDDLLLELDFGDDYRSSYQVSLSSAQLDSKKGKKIKLKRKKGMKKFYCIVL